MFTQVSGLQLSMSRVLLVFSVLGVWSCGQKGNSFLVEGTLENAQHVQTVALYEGERKLDSVFLNEQGKFRLRRAASQPRLYTLVIGKHRFPIIAQNGEELRFDADLMSETQEYTVSGSPLSEKIRSYASIQRDFQEFEERLEVEFSTRSSDLNDTEIIVLREEFLVRYRVFMKDHVERTTAFAYENDDLAGFYAMNTLDRELAEMELIEYAEHVRDRYEDNVMVRQFVQELDRLKRLAIGQPAPGFESLTANNRTVRLSDFNGEYTLVDFWASWCVPCRDENPNIVKQYERFKGQGFNVFGVSLDGNPGAWLRAVEEDGLEWTNVSDLQAWGSEVVGLYDIKAIPTSYLLDPDGIIIAKNLRGAELERFLVELFADVND